MPWYIIEVERTTVTKYVVEAAEREDVQQKSDRWEYLGYRDGDTTWSRISGPFESHDTALDDPTARVDGH